MKVAVVGVRMALRILGGGGWGGALITEPLNHVRRSLTHEGVSKSFRTGRLEREQQMVQLSATRCNCIAIL
jgi:hypothetical protein